MADAFFCSISAVQYAANIYKMSDYLWFQGQFLPQQPCWVPGWFFWGVGGLFPSTKFKSNGLSVSSLKAVAKTKHCFLNDTSVLETSGQQPPDVCESYFRPNSVSQSDSHLQPACVYPHWQNSLSSPQNEQWQLWWNAFKPPNKVHWLMAYF